MPSCEGRPDEPCPFKRNDSSVTWTIADLFLCPDCEKFRFPQSVSDNMLETGSAFVKQDNPAIAAATVTDVTDPNDKRFARCELLYFIQNKCGVLTFDKLVSICTNFYRCNEVEAARILLAKYKRLTKHIGGTDDERRERTVIDIIKLCLTPTAGLPVYYSVDMSRIPPVGVEHVDVSALLQEVSALREEVRSFATIRSDIVAMRQTLSSVPTLQMSPTPSSEVASIQEDIPAIIREMAAVEIENTPTYAAAAAAAVTVNGSSNSNGPSFAALASLLKGSDMAGKPSRVEKKPQSHRPVVGRSTTASRLKSIITKRPIDIFVSRLSPFTVVSDVKNCVNDILGGDLIDSIECSQLKSKFEDLYSSFYVSVLVDVRDMKHVFKFIYSPESWPEGILVRRYFKPKNA